jgi:hypothetical protein
MMLNMDERLSAACQARERGFREIVQRLEAQLLEAQLLEPMQRLARLAGWAQLHGLQLQAGRHVCAILN